VALHQNYKRLQEEVVCSEPNYHLQCPTPTFGAKPSGVTGKRPVPVREGSLPGLLEKLLELVFEVSGGDRSFGGVGDGLLAEVVEGEGSGRGESPAPGLIQNEPHQLQRHLRVGLALFQGASLRSAAISFQLFLGGEVCSARTTHPSAKANPLRVEEDAPQQGRFSFGILADS
jgi:hypothetical protein